MFWFFEWFLQYSKHFCTISLKNTKIYFKIGTKSSDIGTESWRKILKGLKQKVGIFIGIKNIFNSYFNIKM